MVPYTHYNMSDVTENYLMSPELFNNLSYVQGFNNLNGKTYQDHIVIILGEILSDEYKEEILKATTPSQALAILDTAGIKYTHSYE